MLKKIVFFLNVLILVFSFSNLIFAEDISGTQKGFTVSGRIIGSDTDGYGLSGAVVDIYPLLGDNPIAGVSTREEGVFTMFDVKPGDYFLKIHKEGYVDAITENFTVAKNTVGYRNVTLKKILYSISGRIFSDEVNHLPNAELKLLSAGDNSELAKTVSNANGMYAFEDINPGNYFIEINSDKFYSQKSDVISINNESVSGRHFTLNPLPSYSVKIAVTDKATQANLNNAELKLLYLNPDSGKFEDTEKKLLYSGETNEYRFEKLYNGKYQLKINKSGYIGMNYEFAIDSADVNYTFEIEKGRYKIRAKVKDQIDDAALFNYKVQITKKYDGQQILIPSEDISISGDEFTISHLEYGEYKLSVFSQNYSPYQKSFLVESDIDANIKMERGETYNISGKISGSDTKNKGIENAELTLYQGNEEIAKVYTNSEGRYTFEAVPAGENYSIKIYAENYQIGEINSFEVKSKNIIKNFNLRISVFDISGKITANGSEVAVSDAVVELFKVNGEKTEAVESVRTNSKGEYNFTETPVFENYKINVRAFKFDDKNSIPFKLKDASITDFNFALNPVFTKFTLAGRILDKDNLPIENANIQLKLDNKDVKLPQKTDKNGYFEFTELFPYPNYSIEIIKDGYTTKSLEAIKVFTDVKDISVTLEREENISVSGKVIEQNSQSPVSEATVTIKSSKDSKIYLMTITDADGYFYFNKISKNSNYTITVSKVGYSTTLKDIAESDNINDLQIPLTKLWQ